MKHLLYLLTLTTYSCVATVCFKAADCLSDGDVDALNSISTSTLIAPPVVGGGVEVGSKVGFAIYQVQSGAIL